MSRVHLNGFFVLRQRAEFIRDSRSNYRQSLGNTNAWVNSDCSFHKISSRNNNTGIVLHFSLGNREGVRPWEADGKRTGKLCSKGPLLIPLPQAPAFGIRSASCIGRSQACHTIFTSNPLGTRASASLGLNEETNTKGKIRPC